MGQFGEWVIHRGLLLGMKSQEELAEASALPIETIRRICESGSLRGVGRSARGLLARTLKVTIRDLEALAAGKREWIDDSCRVDFDRLTPDPLRLSRGKPSADEPEPIECPCERGVPIVGRILDQGVADFFGEWLPQEVQRLPLRYRGVPDAFALQMTGALGVYGSGTALVFRGLPPGELNEAEIALITRGDEDGESRVCRVARKEECALELSSLNDDERTVIAMESVVRAARVIGTHNASDTEAC